MAPENVAQIYHRCIKLDVAIPGKRISVIKKHIKENCTSLHFFLYLIKCIFHLFLSH
jgi:hypothetical protein